MKFEWKQIDDNDFRAMVPGGWLVKSITWLIAEEEGSEEIPEQKSQVSVCFVPDKDHLWEIDNNEVQL